LFLDICAFCLELFFDLYAACPLVSQDIIVHSAPIVLRVALPMLVVFLLLLFPSVSSFSPPSSLEECVLC